MASEIERIARTAIACLQEQEREPVNLHQLLVYARSDVESAMALRNSDEYPNATAEHCAGAILYCVAAYVMAGGKDLVADIESRAKVGL